MNLLFVIGNGFDKNLGLNTGYPEFYNWYTSTPSSCDAVRQLKESISGQYQNWSDLELGLGKYTENISNLDDAIEIYDDIVNGMQDYLSQEVEKYSYDIVNKETILYDIFHPERYLRYNESKNIFAHFDRSEGWNARIITFNYTQSFEKILGNPQLPIQIDFEKEGTRSVTHIVHIHGYVRDRMILGVDDASQIANKDLRNNKRFSRRYIKSENNKTYQLTHVQECTELISQSHIICLFGLSLGWTDKSWWKKIAEKVSSNSSIRLIIFDYRPNFMLKGNLGPKYQDYVDDVVDRFLAAAGFSIESNFRNQIYVCFTPSIFDFKLSKIQKDNAE